MAKLTTLLAAGLACSTFLVAPAFAADVPEGTVLADDQTFTYRILDEFTSPDPQIVEDVAGSEIVRDLFEGLLNQDAQGHPVPGVATEWEASEDFRTWTFHLREEARWSDGEPVTAHDFVYAWQRLVDPETASPYAWFGELMALENATAIIAGEAEPATLGVEATDDHTLVVRLSEGLTYFPSMLSHASTFPSPRWAIEAHGNQWTRPENIVVNGAYTLAEHVPNERSVRVRNEAYWDNENTVLERVVALVINDDNQALTRFLAGELDRTEIPTGQYPRLAEEYPDTAITFPVLCTYYFNYNLRDTALEATQDPRVRQALSYALDRDVIVNQVLQGGQTSAYTFTPPGMNNYAEPNIAYATMTQAERDAEAVRLLEEAGYGRDNPIALEILYNTSDAHRQIATVMGQMWQQKLGVQVTLANMEWNTFLDARGQGNFDVSRGGWCADFNDPSSFMDLFNTSSGYNDAAYSNEEVDALLAQARSQADASAIYAQLEEIVAEDMPVIPVYHYADAYMLNPQIQVWPVENVEKNWYSKDLYRVAE